MDKILIMRKKQTKIIGAYEKQDIERIEVKDQDMSFAYSSSSIVYSSNWENFFSTTQKGIAVSEVSKVIALGPFKADFYCAALDISTKTLDRYIADKRRLNPNDSELVLKWKALFAQGNETFDSYNAFGGWLQKPAHGLNGIQPKELMKTSRGVDLIMEELQRIEWGQLS